MALPRCADGSARQSPRGLNRMRRDQRQTNASETIREEGVPRAGRVIPVPARDSFLTPRHRGPVVCNARSRTGDNDSPFAIRSFSRTADSGQDGLRFWSQAAEGEFEGGVALGNARPHHSFRQHEANVERVLVGADFGDHRLRVGYTDAQHLCTATCHRHLKSACFGLQLFRSAATAQQA